MLTRAAIRVSRTIAGDLPIIGSGDGIRIPLTARHCPGRRLLHLFDEGCHPMKLVQRGPRGEQGPRIHLPAAVEHMLHVSTSNPPSDDSGALGAPYLIVDSGFTHYGYRVQYGT
jgi:hypothetical protein